MADAQPLKTQAASPIQTAKPVEKAEAKAKKASYKVVTEFRDRNNFNLIHEVGADVSDLDPKVLESLVERKLVKEA